MSDGSTSELDDGDVQERVDSFVWGCYMEHFTEQQRTLFKQALAEKHPQFEIHTGTKHIINRNRIVRFFKHRYDGQYPLDYSLFSVKTAGRETHRIVIPKGDAGEGHITEAQ
jgi:hypothetical protein